jgi:hypothetical protein
LATEVKATGGIFFPGYWLAGSLQFHVTMNTRAIVDEYLRTDVTLQPGLEPGGSKTNADTALAKCARMRYMFPEIWKNFGDFGAREPDNAHDSE